MLTHLHGAAHGNGYAGVLAGIGVAIAERLAQLQEGYEDKALEVIRRDIANNRKRNLAT